MLKIEDMAPLKCKCIIVILGYLLPIVNRLLIDKELSTRPPYALILLPTVELCHQVSLQP